MKRQVGVFLALVLLPLSASVVAGCGAGAPAPQTAAAPGIAEQCEPARCGERPLVAHHECSNGGFAGVGTCVKNSSGGCGWRVSDCGSGR